MPVHLIYEGRVQGVGFRYTARETAKEFMVVGWVKNRPDGSVELLVQGEEVEAYLDELENQSEVAHFIKQTRRLTTPDLDPSLCGFQIHH